jgi:hypothetical protein
MSALNSRGMQISRSEKARRTDANFFWFCSLLPFSAKQIWINIIGIDYGIRAEVLRFLNSFWEFGHGLKSE